MNQIKQDLMTLCNAEGVGGQTAIVDAAIALLRPLVVKHQFQTFLPQCLVKQWKWVVKFLQENVLVASHHLPI